MSPSIEHLKTNHHNLGEQHRCCVEKEDYIQLESTLNDLTLSSQLTHTSLSVYDLNRRAFLLHPCCNPKAIHHPVFAWQAGDTNCHYYDFIHPDDLPYVLEGHIEAYELLESVPPQEKSSKTLCMLFRVKNEKGGYRLIFYRMAVLRLDRKDKLWLLLIYSTLLTDCTSKEVPRGYCLSSFSQHNNKLVLTCNKTSVNLISNREYEVLCLLIVGYENYQIADILGITENTVKEHRHNLEHHFGAKDMPQAFVFAMRLGLI